MFPFTIFDVILQAEMDYSIIHANLNKYKYQITIITN